MYLPWENVFSPPSLQKKPMMRIGWASDELELLGFGYDFWIKFIANLDKDIGLIIFTLKAELWDGF